jgi:hypothetical protein
LNSSRLSEVTGGYALPDEVALKLGEQLCFETSGGFWGTWEGVKLVVSECSTRIHSLRTSKELRRGSDAPVDATAKFG